jgi:hypothetical protein
MTEGTSSKLGDGAVNHRSAGLPERIRRNAKDQVAKPLNRRAFLATGMVAAVGLAVVNPANAGAADTDLVVYRLNPDWGYPVGPKGKTRCSCRACFRRAENAYFETEAAAIAGRIHPCCVCQVYRSTVAGIPREALFAGADSADRRDERVAAVFASVPTAAPAGDLLGAAAPSATAASGFARTGISMRFAAAGAALVAAGGALITFRNRQSGANAGDLIDHQGEPS